MARFVGRLLLWGCVLLLLIRGIASYLDPEVHTASATRSTAVTVGRPAGPVQSGADGK